MIRQGAGLTFVPVGDGGLKFRGDLAQEQVRDRKTGRQVGAISGVCWVYKGGLDAWIFKTGYYRAVYHSPDDAQDAGRKWAARRFYVES